MIGILCALLAVSAVSFDAARGNPVDLGLVVVGGVQEVPGTDNNARTNTDVVRQQRSPGYGLLKDYDDYSYDDYPGPRHVKFGHRHKHPHFHHKPHGCHGHGCGGFQPDYGDHYGGGHGGSFATASAGSQGGFHGGSQANAQSATFSFGPYSASFSVAQSSSGH